MQTAQVETNFKQDLIATLPTNRDINAALLLDYIKDAKRPGRARRLALDVGEQLRPGTREALLTSWLEDPEFRYEAVDHTLKEADALAREAKKEQSLAVYRKAFAAVREAAVVGRPDPIYGEQVVAYVAVQGAWSEEVAQELRQYAARRLSPQKVPVDFMALDALPRNQMGKVERRLLRMREQARAAACKVEHTVFVS